MWHIEERRNRKERAGNQEKPDNVCDTPGKWTDPDNPRTAIKNIRVDKWHTKGHRGSWVVTFDIAKTYALLPEPLGAPPIAYHLYPTKQPNAYSPPQRHDALIKNRSRTRPSIVNPIIKRRPLNHH